MKIKELFEHTAHRPWNLPKKKWKYYQEWNRVIFLHWRVELEDIRPLVPAELDIDSIHGTYWVSIVVFSVENTQTRILPPFKLLSNYQQVNIRTYVKHKNRPGVFFLNVEASKWWSCLIAKSLSGIQYRPAEMDRTDERFDSFSKDKCDNVNFDYELHYRVSQKNELDYYLTERYALFTKNRGKINEYNIHHLQWPLRKIELRVLFVKYPQFPFLMQLGPAKTHYSEGVQVLIWGKT
ncbi:MAG: DUF2071 domain-containing protein [Bacteroidia bacterium]